MIPVIFLMLRVWTMIITVIYEYAKVPEKNVPYAVGEILVYLSVSCPGSLVYTE